MSTEHRAPSTEHRAPSTRIALIAAVLVFTLPIALSAQVTVLPDMYGDEHLYAAGYRKNLGQVRDTDGDAVPDIFFKSERSPIGIYMRSKSQVSFVLATQHNDSLQPDTLYRVDMAMLGNDVDPQALPTTVGGPANYYRDSTSVESVPSFQRVAYPSIADSIDAHFYYGSTGPRIAFVIHPGGDPNTLKLQFTGQDSLGIDWQGALKIYMEDKWIELREAVAYQVDSWNNVLPVNWTASYIHDAGTSFVGFSFGDIDPDLPLVLQIGYPPLPLGGGGGTANLSWSTTVGSDLPDAWGDYIMGGDHLPDADLIVTGHTSDPDFPATTGMTILFLQGRDIFVSRFDHEPGDPDHDAELLWTTFIIGSGYDQPHVIKYATDHDKIYVGGSTYSAVWPMIPTVNPNDGSYYQSTLKGQVDGFIVMLEPVAGFLERSTLYGGSGNDIITTIVTDGFGQVHCFGVTSSTTGNYDSCNSPATGLPLCDPGTNNYQQDNNAGGLDMFVARFNYDFDLTWGSFIGGTGDDRVIDSDYLPNNSQPLDRIALVGRTNGTLPYGSSGDFQLTSCNTGTCGFIWLFNSQGRQGWGTHLNGTTDMQAVSFGKDHVRAMGLTGLSPGVNIEETCEAVSGSLSVCGGNTDLDYIAHYLVAFDMQTYGMGWSTILNGFTDASADVAVFLYPAQALHAANRMMDIKTNANDHFMIMGMVAQLGPGMISSFPTQPLWGMYHKPFNINMGYEQNEVLLALYSNTHEQQWCSMFGSYFEHLGAASSDSYLLSRGLDYGHDLVWVDGDVLYLVGSTGGVNFDRQCPYFPVPSYCELIELPLFAAGDTFDGMIARFDMSTIVVGIPTEGEIKGITPLILHPNPAGDVLYITITDNAYNAGSVVVLDATGRTVLRTVHVRGMPISVRELATGAYTLVLFDDRGAGQIQGRFIRL